MSSVWRPVYDASWQGFVRLIYVVFFSVLSFQEIQPHMWADTVQELNEPSGLFLYKRVKL